MKGKFRGVHSWKPSSRVRSRLLSVLKNTVLEIKSIPAIQEKYTCFLWCWSQEHIYLRGHMMRWHTISLKTSLHKYKNKCSNRFSKYPSRKSRACQGHTSKYFYWDQIQLSISMWLWNSLACEILSIFKKLIMCWLGKCARNMRKKKNTNFEKLQTNLKTLILTLYFFNCFICTCFIMI